MEKVGLKRWALTLATLALSFVGGIDVAQRWTSVTEYQALGGFLALACAFYCRAGEWNAGFEQGQIDARR